MRFSAGSAMRNRIEQMDAGANASGMATASCATRSSRSSEASVEDHHDVSQEQHEVHRALQDVGLAAAEGQRADEQGEQQQHHLDGIEAELDARAGDQP